MRHNQKLGMINRNSTIWGDGYVHVSLSVPPFGIDDETRLTDNEASWFEEGCWLGTTGIWLEGLIFVL